MLAKIDMGVFKNLTSLENLYLSYNQLESISLNEIHLSSLKTLDLHYNQFVAVESNLFLGLSSIEVLDLSSNQIAKV